MTWFLIYVQTLRHIPRKEIMSLPIRNYSYILHTTCVKITEWETDSECCWISPNLDCFRRLIWQPIRRTHVETDHTNIHIHTHIHIYTHVYTQIVTDRWVRWATDHTNWSCCHRLHSFNPSIPYCCGVWWVSGGKWGALIGPQWCREKLVSRTAVGTSHLSNFPVPI